MYYYTMFFKKFDFIDPDWSEIFGSKIKNLQKITKFWGRMLWAWYAPSAVKKVPTSPELDHYFNNKNFQKVKKFVFSLEIEDSLENFSKVPVIWNMNYSFSDT